MTCSLPQSPLNYNTNFTAIADTGASHHYCHGLAPVHSCNYSAPPTTVSIANGAHISSIGTAKLPLPNLPPGTEDCHVIPTFVNNLMSIGKFCDAGCKVVFTSSGVSVLNKAVTAILQDFREVAGARMWRFNIDPTSPATVALSATTPQMRHQSSAHLPHLIPFDDDDDCATTDQQTDDHHIGLPCLPTIPPMVSPTAPPAIHRPPPTRAPTRSSKPTTSPPKRSTDYHRRAYNLPSTRHLVKYLHAAAGSPVKSTFLRAINNGNYRSFPGLNATNVARYCPSNATATVLGHSTQTRQGIRSTRWATAANALLTANASTNMLPSTKLFMALTTPDTDCATAIMPIATLFTNDLGRFPIRAMSGNQYIMLAYHDATNVILVQPFQSQADHHRIPAYNTLVARLKARGLTVDRQVLDNQASQAMQQAIRDNGWVFQFVPPDMHRRNKAERAIRTFKAHFISILAGTDPAFPKNRWDLLLPQAELTVNLLRQSSLQPHMSAWEHFNGPFNFDATPMGPPGCRIISHAKGSKRLSWDYRGHQGFYVRPALDHYRCYTVVKTSTSAVVVTDTVTFQHPTLSIPTLTTTDCVIHCLQALTVAIQADRTPDNCHAQLLAVESLRAIFNPPRARPLPTSYASPPRVGAPLPRVPTTPLPTSHASIPRVVSPIPQIPTAQPIAHCTHSQLELANAVTFSLPPTHVDKYSGPFRAASSNSDTAHMTSRRKTTYNLPAEWTYVPRYRKPSIITRRQPTIVTQRPSTPTSCTSAVTKPTFNRFALLADDNPNDDVVSVTATAYSVMDLESGELLEHRQLRHHPKHKDKWDQSYANKIGCLCQGVGRHPTEPNAQRIAGTNCMHPIHFKDIPRDRISDVAHTRVVCDVRPTKPDPDRTRITIGGNTIDYIGNCGTKTASLETVKLIINSTLSTPNAQCATSDLANFYLNTPLDRPEYARIHISVMPQEIVDEYNLNQYTHNGWVYFELTKGMYGLKQAGKLANDLLSSRLNNHGYYECATTPGLWRHKWRPVIFALIVDDFAIQYTGRHHAKHLLAAINEHYEVTTDWNAMKFAGINLKWDYTKRTCRLTMDDYIKDVRHRFGHPDPLKPQHSPHKHRPIIYRAAAQLVTNDIDTSPPLDAKGTKHVQSVNGCILYYAQAVDNKLLCTLSAIGMKQASATRDTLNACNQLLDYLTTHPNNGITYKASNMILAAHSDASYLSESKSRSRAGAHIFLSNDDPIPQSNGPLLSIAAVLRSVYASEKRPN